MLVFKYEDLCSAPTLCVGHTADLKYEDERFRVWKSRCGIEDGELDPIQVEELVDGRWVDVTTKNPPVIVVGQSLGARHGVRTQGGVWRRDGFHSDGGVR